jgi:CHAT domain-containing protein
VIAPDGPLCALNFETLPIPGSTPHFWIQDVTISVAPSLSLLALGGAPRKPGGPPSLLLIGDPISPLPAQFPNLQFGPREIAAIDSALPNFQKTVIRKERAQPAVYAQSAPGNFDYIHFVAHGVANSQYPLESAVILSSDGKEYELRARDVVTRRLKASLVSLSSCRSAGARIYAGEGLVGFPWAFLQAGARSVVAGLWDVDDESTARLMSQLYAAIGRGRDPAAALREAKLNLIQTSPNWSKPYYWGPFELFTRVQ